MTEARSLQTEIGPSEIGNKCDRRLAYRFAGTPRVNFPDPLRSMAGTGMHEVLANYFRRLDGGAGRYLVEHKVTYRGISGSVDLYDRRRRILIDWKSPLKAKAKKVTNDGPDHGYVVQVHTYGAGLREQGELVERVGLCFIPPDGTLDDMRVWAQPLDIELANTAINRVETLREQASRVVPGSVDPTPSHLCGWCPYWREGSTDLNVACPGQSTRRK
jgi:hypothetical protein